MLIFFSFGSHSKKPFTIFDVIIRVLSSRLHYKIPVESLFLTVYLSFKLNKLEGWIKGKMLDFYILSNGYRLNPGLSIDIKNILKMFCINILWQNIVKIS